MTGSGKRHPRRGLTLLEMLVVLAIITLVITLGAPRLMETFGRAKAQTAQAQMATLKGAVQLFYIDTGRYPTQAEGLAALLDAPAGATGWRGPYLDGPDDMNDPWGQAYGYRVPGDSGPFGLESLGRDGQPGGTGEDSDISL